MLPAENGSIRSTLRQRAGGWCESGGRKTLNSPRSGPPEPRVRRGG